MYPIPRLWWQFFSHRKSPAISLTDEHVSSHICWPWDLDIWWELNNGRTLTLYDLGRLPMARRAGMIGVLKKNGWGLTVAGSTTRYRRRVRAFDRITMRSRVAGWDERFFYMEQSMWKTNGDCASHVLIRSAFVGKSGIVDPNEVMAAMGHEGPAMRPAPWIEAWIEAEAQRPWPPMQETAGAPSA
ncbi:acyl-CoA thioesterase [Histidinibacterium aquaticum]|uniref:Acyl-CoA thioesterase n=1 Tax=Histidinibacterium aquaticum TaxID=2613962 RepID=A0A5J5GGW7_9RHOB|nr:acyl-CoA thioesterase [Histidinibacterium aquaticum]KAA9006978.1 acyl-CoA thioesterase [Histidinibacterium aquaticum]